MIPDQSPQLLLEPVSPRSRIKMLKQMAAALEAEVAGLCSKASSFEEEESLLREEVGRHHAELQRLSARLEAIRAERDELLEQIETVTNDAMVMREEVSNNEAELAAESVAKLSGRIVGSGSRARRHSGNLRRRWSDDKFGPQDE
jgi:uncharacterized coiled-coil DUF342 family protein